MEDLPMSLLYPLLLMVGLTFLIMPLMLIVRVRSVTQGQVSARYFVNFQTQQEVPARVIQYSRHYTNLFEAPVLFYAVCILALAKGIDGPMLTYAGYSYVGLRVLHSFVHLTYNSLLHRMIPFLMSNLVLFYLWARVGITLTGMH